MRIGEGQLEARYGRGVVEFVDEQTWVIPVRFDDGEIVETRFEGVITVANPTPNQEQARNVTRTIIPYRISQTPDAYIKRPPDDEIIRRAIASIDPKVGDIGTDVPPLGHRSQGDVTFLEDAQLPATYNMYQNLTIGKRGTPAVPTAVPPIEAVPDIAPTISTQPGGAIIVVQDTLTINAGHLSADNSGAGVAAHGGWVGQPEEDHVSHGKVQEMLELLRRTDFRFQGNGWNASPVGGGGGGLPGGSPPGRGFTYCGQGGEGGPSGVFNVETHPGHGGGVLVIVTRNLVNHGAITARGGSVTDSQDNSGGGGGGFVAILYETAERIGNASARGGSAAGTGQPGKDGEVYASPLPASVMVMV